MVIAIVQLVKRLSMIKCDSSTRMTNQTLTMKQTERINRTFLFLVCSLVRANVSQTRLLDM
jgi:hypothetical protein